MLKRCSWYSVDMNKRNKTNRYPHISEEEKAQLRKKINASISRYCGVAALVIIFVTFASFILGKGDEFFSQCGIMISIMLLALSVINNPDRK